MSDEPGANGTSGPRHALRVFRLQPGERVTVRTLSEAYGGLFTHFVRGRSVYCDPASCNPANHRTGRFWKGYAAAELWIKKEGLYLPIVLEITEALELDLRGRWARGQLWELSRERQVGKRRPPLVGVYIGKASGPIPPAFPVEDVLTHLYHADAVQLDQANPMPARVMVTPSIGAPPPGAQKPGEIQEKPDQSAEAAQFWQQARARMAGFLKDQEKKN